MKVGFVGLGNMGFPMALNLMKAGFEVYGKNRSQGKEREFAAKGGRTGLSLAELAAQMDVVLTCLPLPADVEGVYSGAEGLIANARKGLVLIDCSTVSPELSRKLYAQASEAGVEFLDAPVSGGTTGAEAGTLSVMVGGREDVFNRVHSVLEAFGKSIRFVGDAGSGSAVKLINQLMVGIHTLAVGEAYALAEQAGLDSDKLFGILNDSFAQSKIMERHYTQFIAKDSFRPGFALKLLAKDMNLAADMGAASQVRLNAGKRAQALINQAVLEGYGDTDMSGMYKFQVTEDRKRRESGERKHFAVFLPMLDPEKSVKYRAEHLQFLADNRAEGRLHANGRFVDGAGGLVIYRGSSLEEVESLVQQDPYVKTGARGYEIHEWEIVLADN
ncbi:NAD(P)-binding domain-containing protein [Cohnella zeiphila]|uniref:NAD-binding protein n=1 Tax=Cohnella zeiphila TaxID=2761120 RepID=A0A7X0SNX8_9BACL|nr:NAD(P)-binding domain-containing protein [Cohnella zeiphila]MBB6733472.1 NAD-binding protein [Cohnella zeiphila]